MSFSYIKMLSVHVNKVQNLKEKKESEGQNGVYHVLCLWAAWSTAGCGQGRLYPECLLCLLNSEIYACEYKNTTLFSIVSNVLK